MSAMSAWTHVPCPSVVVVVVLLLLLLLLYEAFLALVASLRACRCGWSVSFRLKAIADRIASVRPERVESCACQSCKDLATGLVRYGRLSPGKAKCLFSNFENEAQQSPAEKQRATEQAFISSVATRGYHYENPQFDCLDCKQDHKNKRTKAIH